MSRRHSRQAAALKARNYHKPTIKPEDAMAFKSDAAFEDFVKDADPETVRRLTRIKEDQNHDKDVWLKKLMTRADVFNAMALWQTKFLMPLAARLDHVETYLEYLEKPFYERWWIRFKMWAIWVGAWIAPKLPFKFTKLDEEEDDSATSEG